MARWRRSVRPNGCRVWHRPVRAEMSERSIDLAAGDLLMFYTDGITEAFSAEGVIFGDLRLQQVLTTYGHEGVTEILDRIDAAVNQFVADYPVSDDITLIALKRLPL